MDERRRVTRRARDFDVTCYIDGAKLEAHVLDISRGGVFVRTDTSRPVPVGALAGIVFVPEKVKIATTFMFGRVVRRQDTPVRGFGIRWEKAVSAGRPEELSEFLKALVDLEDVTIEQEVVGTSSSGGSISRCVYRFPEQPSAIPGTGDAVVPDGSGAQDESDIEDSVEVVEEEPVEAVTPAPSADAAIPPSAAPVPENEAAPAARPGRRRAHVPTSAPAPATNTDIFSCFSALEVTDEEISAVRITTGPARPGNRRPARESVVPVEVVQPMPAQSAPPSFRGVDDVLVPCRVDGSIFVIDASVPVVVTALGQTAAVVRSRFVPVDDTQPLTLVLIIGTRRGDVPVRCHGRVTVIERGIDSGFRMVFSNVEEGDSPGVLERYLKWLEFNAGSSQ